MTTEERLSSAERYIAELRDQFSTLGQGQAAHDTLLSRMGDLVTNLAFAYVDVGSRLGRIEVLMGRTEDRRGRTGDRRGRTGDHRERLETMAQDLARAVQSLTTDMAAIKAILERKRNGQGP